MEMKQRAATPPIPWLRLLAFLLCAAVLAASLAAAVYLGSSYLTRMRGVEPRTSNLLVGTNVALEQYVSEAEQSRALGRVKSAGLTTIRQHFSWREIEAVPGHYDWSTSDRIVALAAAANLRLVAVLDTAPTWAQRDYERDLPGAPPDNFEDYAHFAAAFARRYGESVDYYEIWDEPNVHPGWGRRNAEPAEYARFLHLAAQAIRANDPGAKIVLGGLGMNLETQRPHPDYSEVLFLRGLYEAGAQNDFDVVAAKPYGMWTGPEDRRVSSSVLNFSRVILLREEMKQHGDAAKPVWAVDAGWNALPRGWEGRPSPWGSDSEAVQSDRLLRALARARDEWGWMGAVFANTLQPNAAADDPRWGFALLTPDFKPREFYTALADFTSNPPPAERPPSAPVLSLALLALVATVAAWGSVQFAPRAELAALWSVLERRFAALPEMVQFGVLVLALCGFYLSPSAPLNLLLLALLAPLWALRLDLGLVLLVLTIPFYLYPKTLFGGFQLSLVEVLTLVGAAAWVWTRVLHVALPAKREPLFLAAKRELASALSRFSSLDWAVVAFVVLGVLSTRAAANFGVANRELRVIVAEPALLYALLRLTNLSRGQLLRLANALLLAGAAVCVIGLAQLAAGDVIAADGLGRVRAVWGSPNNAALFLGRLLPLAAAMALFLKQPRQRVAYAALTALLAVVLYLTFSRGALFLGVPAGLAFLAMVWLWRARGRVRIPRAGWLIGGVLLLASIAALASTARFQSMFQEGTGTGFFRLAVWQSALHMIADHPFFGVGLDNFLYEYPKYILPEAWREPNLSHPHNFVLDFWVRLGVFGVVVLAWLQIEFFRRAWRVLQTRGEPYRYALAAGLAASMVDFLAHGLIDAAYFVVDLAFVFMLTIGAMDRLAREQDE